MLNRSLGFIGGGRITRIFLERLENLNKLPVNVFVSDINETVLNELKIRFPKIITGTDNKVPAAADMVFVSLHPPVFIGILEEVKNVIKENSLFISLAPKILSSKILQILGGAKNIVRMIPNSSSIIGEGYNPVWYSKNINDEEKHLLKKFFENFGEAPEVEENLLEACAVITAMGPTYFQFQYEQISLLAASFGFEGDIVKKSVSKMLEGSVKLWADQNYTFKDVYNLIPIKPFGESEEVIKNIYKEKLNEIFNKLKN